MRSRQGVAAASAAWSAPAFATGSEMAGLRLVVPMLAGIAIVTLAVLYFTVLARLPRHWPRPRRRWVAALAAPAGFLVLLVLYAAFGYVKFRLLR